MADNNPDAQVADSFGEVYNVAVGHKKGSGLIYGKKEKEMLDGKKSV
jgi:hypothetical protein